jgi:MutS domain I
MRSKATQFLALRPHRFIFACPVSASNGILPVFLAPNLGKSLPRHFSAQPRRRAKTKIRVKLEDLPQGILPSEQITPRDVEPAYPTVIQQALNNMRKFENCVLLTRVGGFYEMYFEHAEKFGPLLGLKAADKYTSKGYIKMVSSIAFYWIG